MKRISVVFCLACLSVLLMGTGAVHGESEGSIVGWGEQVVVEQSALDSLVALAAGMDHSLGLRSDGTIVAWGRNREGGRCDVPAPNADFVGVAAGNRHSLGLKSDGTIVAWGSNGEGQCDVPAPNENFMAIAGGYAHSLGLKSDGTIVAWGYNGGGQCDVPAPNADFVAIAAGWYHSLGLKSDGTIVAWGWNEYGQCDVPFPNADFVAIAAGIGHSLGLKSYGTIVAWGHNGEGQCDVPAPNTDFVAVAGGSNHSLGVKSNRTIVAWGWNEYGQCDVPAPNGHFVAIAAGIGHSLGLKSDGTIAAWGANYYGQCNVPAPNADFVAIAVGGRHSLGIKSNRTIVAWGWNEYGQCDVPWPNAHFVAIAAGWYHSLGLKSDGTIVAWGGNDDGQCNIPAPNADFVAVAAGSYHSLGLKSDATIVAWGDNDDGQCNIPAPNTDFVAVAGGFSHSLGLKSDGTIVAWGGNFYGQCDVPAPNEDFVTIAGGFGHSLGLKSDGTIVAWGLNDDHQCDVPEPNTDFLAVASGSAYSLGLKSDGTIVAWGLNDWMCQCCNVPEPNADFVAVAGGSSHSLGLKTSSATNCLVRNTNDSGFWSLREAIINSNAAPDTSVITFSILGTGPHTIQPLSSLPSFTAPVLIDGYTQPGASVNTNGDGLGGNAVLKIVLDGSALSGSDKGLNISAGNSTVRGLVINNFPFNAINLLSDGTVVEGNYIGTDVTGMSALPNDTGIRISGDNNTIGGTDPASRNIISGNNTDGIRMESSSLNQVQGNFIGLNVLGTSGVPNNQNGVLLTTGSNDNVIDNNIISGNALNGVSISAATGGFGNSIQRNFIGSDINGDLPLSNGGHGVRISVPSMSGTDITIGGSADYANVILGNDGDGVNIALQSDATIRAIVSHNSIRSNDNGIVLTSGNATISQNTFCLNGALGIDLNDDGVTANDPDDSDTGPNDLQNFPVIEDANPATSQIQGVLNSEPDRKYTIEFFANAETGPGACDPSGYGEGKRFLGSTTVLTNEFGNASFSVNVSELFDPGESLTATATDSIRGSTSEFSECFPVSGPILVRNTDDSGSYSLRQAIIEANAAPDTSVIAFSILGSGPHAIAPLTPLPEITTPVIIDGYTQLGASENTNGDGLGGNAVLQIGLNGSYLSSPDDHGLHVTGGYSTIRGLAIIGFPGNGIYLASDSNLVEGNYIGTKADGVSGLPNGMGVSITGDGNVIGGAEPAARNVISGNASAGIYMANSASNVVQGNLIGVDASGTSGLSNNHGISLVTEANGNVIDNNVISANAGDGVSLMAGEMGAVGNSVRRNLIGAGVDGTLPLGNSGFGVRIMLVSTSGADNIVGGSTGYANTIANNGDAGVHITLPDIDTLRAVVSHNDIHSNGSSGVVVAQGNAVLSQNDIFSNDGLGIDLNDDGVTANDPGDTDTGPNGLQNFPDLWTVEPESLTVAGELSSTPSTEFDLEFFSSQSCDASGFGEGAMYLGEVRVTTDALGTAKFDKALYTQIPGGHYVTATARPVANGWTSEFSPCVEFINTPVGTNVSVTPVDEATRETPAVLTFDEVTVAGNTLLEISDTGPDVPGTFIVGDSASYYHLSTTAAYSDSILACFSYDEAEIPGEEENLVILHYDTTLVPAEYVDITVSLDTLSNVVCGRTATLSPFVLAVPNPGTRVDPMPEAPARYALYQNVPNPFNPVTVIRYDVPAGGGDVTLRIYDVSGRLVRTLVDGNEGPGQKSITWDGKDARGRMVASGVYFYRLTSETYTQTRKMLLIK